MTIAITHAKVSGVSDDPAHPEEVQPSDWNDQHVVSGAVAETRTISAGSGLTGGGDLSADRTIAADIGTGAAQVAAGDHTHDYEPAAGWTKVTKASDESVTNNTTLQNDDELFFTASSGTLYEVELYVHYLGDGSADLKCAFGEDSTIRGGMLTNSLGPTDGAQAAARNADQTATIGIGTSATKRLAIITGYYTGGGGTWRLLWANNTAAGTTTIKAGSYLRYRVAS